jgi:hypothetical protein
MEPNPLVLLDVYVFKTAHFSLAKLKKVKTTALFSQDRKISHYYQTLTVGLEETHVALYIEGSFFIKNGTS